MKGAINTLLILLLWAVVLTVFSARPTFSQACQWTSLGPTNLNGRITSIAINSSPSRSDQIFVTSVGGLWRSDDNGRRWQRLSDEFIGGPKVLSSVVINPTNSDEVFVSGGDPNKRAWGGGVWRSLHSGNPGSWIKISDGHLDGTTIIRLRIDPLPPNDLYAATNSGVYKGTARADGSRSWARIGGFDRPTSDMVVDFTVTPRAVYVGDFSLETASTSRPKRGIWKFDGVRWYPINTGLRLDSEPKRFLVGHVALAISQTHPNILYAKIERWEPGGSSNGTPLGIFKTTTAGEARGGVDGWRNVLNASEVGEGQTNYNNVIEVDPTDASIVWAGHQTNLFQTTDGGTTWSNVSGGRDPDYPLGIHADHHAIVFDSRAGRKVVYVGTDGGVYKSTDTRESRWHWNESSHGMIITEFYNIGLQQSLVTLTAGGTQDNGSNITYGNHAWYNYMGCDGARVAVDAMNSSTLYGECNGGLGEDPNPVFYSLGGGDPLITWDTPAGVTPINPLVTDSKVPGAALAAGVMSSGGQVLLKTTDGVRWLRTEAPLTTSGEIKTIAIGPLSVSSTSFRTYYVGVFEDNVAKVWRSRDAGRTWGVGPTTIPGSTGKEPSAIAIEPTDHSRAFAAIGRWNDGVVLLTTDWGNTWSELRGTGSTALPNTGIGGIVIDPASPNTVFVATRKGVFKGRVSRSSARTLDASWEPFNEGIPDGIDVYDIWSNPANGLLYIGTFGYGVFERDIRRKSCPSTLLVVRDCVMDRGFESPNDVPDPEHPIPDETRHGFYKPDDTAAGRLYWWQSTDIRIDVPSVDPPANRLMNVDSVEFETCPLEYSNCPQGSLVDSFARRGLPATAYVQVTNRGTVPARKTRVILLHTDDATAGLPDLPDDFWTRTFPADPSTPCGPLTPDFGWTAVDPTTPCRTIEKIEPSMPGVVGFRWTVSPTASEHTCMIAIIESTDDPIQPSVRASNERRIWILVPENRQITVRNLHVIDGPKGGDAAGGSEALSVLNPDRLDQRPIDLYFSKAGMPDKAIVAVLLPPLRSVPLSLRGIARVQANLTRAERTKFGRMGLDTTVAYQMFAKEGVIAGLPIPPRTTWKIGLLYNAVAKGRPNSAARFTVLERQGPKLLGGSTYILRYRGRS